MRVSPQTPDWIMRGNNKTDGSGGAFAVPGMFCAFVSQQLMFLPQAHKHKNVLTGCSLQRDTDFFFLQEKSQNSNRQDSTPQNCTALLSINLYNSSHKKIPKNLITSKTKKWCIMIKCSNYAKTKLRVERRRCGNGWYTPIVPGKRRSKEPIGHRKTAFPHH